MSYFSTSQRYVEKGKPTGPPPVRSADHISDNLGNALLRKVLVVDDETELADLASMLLNAFGLEAVTAYSARDAIQLLATDSDIDAVVSDIVMPEMTGLQLADTIREMYPRIKIVLTSGFTLPEKLAGRERPYLFLSKPYRIDTLLTILRS